MLAARRITALMVTFVQQRKRDLPQRKDRAKGASSQLIDNLTAYLRKTADRRQLTSIQLESDVAW